MLVRSGSCRRFTALCLALFCGSSGCAATAANDAAMNEIDRLRAALQQNEARMAAMQAHQIELSQQISFLSAFVGAMAQDAARKEENARKKEILVGNSPAILVAPANSTPPVQPPNDLEF